MDAISRISGLKVPRYNLKSFITTMLSLHDKD